jgi:hypothetical protein
MRVEVYRDKEARYGHPDAKLLLRGDLTEWFAF